MTQAQIKLWKIVLRLSKFELGFFGLRDQCSSKWAKGIQYGYEATGSYDFTLKIEGKVLYYKRLKFSFLASISLVVKVLTSFTCVYLHISWSIINFIYLAQVDVIM